LARNALSIVHTYFDYDSNMKNMESIMLVAVSGCEIN
jgi:hypothetical protein